MCINIAHGEASAPSPNTSQTNGKYILMFFHTFSYSILAISTPSNRPIVSWLTFQ